MRLLRRARSEREGFPEALLFFPGEAAAGDEFFSAKWPEARAVADAELHFFRAFGIPRGGLRELAGLRVIAAGLRALVKGHGIGKPSGDVRMLPGMHLVRGDRILWQQVFEHAGELPDLDGAARAARESGA